MSKIGENPYPGSRAFQQADHGRFFGRDADTGALSGLWMTNRLTVLTGPVGSGKTSLLRAGVYPALPARQQSVLPVGTPSAGVTFPFAALPDHNPFSFGLLRSWSPDEAPTRLAGITVSDFLRRHTQAGMQGSDDSVYAAIDQLDDLFLDPAAAPRAKWRRGFFTELRQACADYPRLHLLLVARSEVAGRLAAEFGIGARHAITGLAVQDATDAITKPALGAGRCFTGDAAAILVNDLRTTRLSAFRGERSLVADRVEPALLQVVCQRLWDKLPHGTADISDWAVQGCADAALAAHCGDVLGLVALEYQVQFNRLRSWLLDNFVTDSGTRGSVYEGHDTAGLPNTVPRSLVDRHLLTAERDESVRRYQLLASRLIEPVRMAHAMRVAPPTAAEYLAAAERDLAQGELDCAADHADRALHSASGHRQQALARTLLGNAAAQEGRPDDAVAHYREAAALLQAAGDTGAAAGQLAAAGQCLLAMDRAADALPELQAAVKRAPSDLRVQTQLALAFWQLGDGRAAVAVLSWVLSSDGSYAQARRARGEILADLGDGREAMDDLNRAVPGDPSTQAARGLAFAELGDHAAAAEEIDAAVNRAERNGPVLLYAARTSDLAGDKAAARKRAREAIDATDPPLSAPHRQLARKLAKRW